MITAYSYTRFSTPEQAEGDSKRRQDAMIQTWLKANPEYELNTTLTFHDAGVRAFRGENAKKGKLARFLKLIEERRDLIPPGSVLLVEEWSRFSRQNPYDGAPVCRQIFDAGVGIVDLRNNIRYDSTTMRDQVIRIRLDLEWERAHRESEEKSIRMQAAWSIKREQAVQGIPMTRTCPAWLQLVNGRYVEHEDPKRVATIQLIFAMKAAGIGTKTIVRKLNGDPGVWHPKEHYRNKRGGWWSSYVEKIIRNRAVLGEFSSPKVPDPIENCFPAVIDEDLFNRVQARIALNATVPGHGGGPNGSVCNVFGGRTWCARCGSTMRHINKGPAPKGFQYLMCDKARRGLGCSKAAVRYDKLEGLLLRLCRGLDPQDLLSDETERAREVLRRQSLEGDLSQVQRQIENLVDQIERTDSIAVRQVLDTRLDERMTRRAELEQELTSAKIAEVRTAEAVAQHIRSIEDLIQRMEQLQGAERNTLRQRLRSALHGLIERLDIEPGLHRSKLRLTFTDGAYLSLVLDSKGALRLAEDGQMLYTFDEHGNIVDVDPVAGESTEAERAERQRKVNALVAKALQKQGLSPNMAWSA